MIITWVKDRLLALLPEQAQEIIQGAQAFEKKKKARLQEEDEDETTFEDVEETRKKSLQLLSKAPKASQKNIKMDKIRLWMNVRRKVGDELAERYKMPEIMEEVTEKLREAASNDSHFKKWFLK